MRLLAFPQWDKLTSLLRGMARQSAADYAQRKIVRIIPKNGIAHLANYAAKLLAVEGGGGSGGTAARYRILRRVPEDGVVVLTDRAVTRVDIATDGGPLRLVVPPEAKGTARDFFVRLVITADEIPEVIFAAPTGEAISFEDVDDDVFKCETGVNVFAFTETDAGIFIVNHKQIDIDQKPTRGLSPKPTREPTRGLSPMACPVWPARLHCGTLRNEIHPSPGR